MRNMKVKTKLLLGFLIVAAATAAVGTTGIIGLRNLWKNETALLTTATNCIISRDLEANLSTQRAYYNAGVLTLNDPDTLSTFIAGIEQLDADFLADVDYLENNIVKQESKAYAAQIKEVYQANYTQERNQLILTLQRGDEATARQLSAGLAQEIDTLQKMTSTLSDQGITQMGIATASDAATAKLLIGVMSVVGVVSVICAMLLGNYISRSISKPVNNLVAAARKLTKGDIDVALTVKTEDELGILAKAFEEMIQGIRMQAAILQKIAHGDYTADIPVRSEQDVMNRSIHTLVENSNKILQQVNETSLQVSFGGDQIAQGAQLLASGATEQSASIEQFSAALTQVHTQTEHNAENANKALDATQKVDQLIDTSTGYMEQMLQAMQIISESTENITKVNKVIDDIAFQTNILALNASVEAARAGQHGKGFAVVADEVRNLASKSAAAAQETSVLIDGSTQSVKQGNDVVQKTNASLGSVAEYARQCLGLIAEIAQSSATQAEAMSTIQQDIYHISEVVQSNSSMAEQSAAAAEEMAGQAAILKSLVSGFQLKAGLNTSNNHNVTSQSPVPAGESFAISSSKY